MPTVLAILAEGFEEIEVTTPIDVLRRAGAEVTLAALGPDLYVTGRCGLTFRAMQTFTEALAASAALAMPLYDCLFLPGGPGVKLLRADPRVREIVLRHHAARRWIAAICAAPTILHDAGILQGRRYTAHPSVAPELPNPIATERTVTDEHILTSRGAGTALDLGLLMVEKLYSPTLAREIAGSICA